MKLPSVYITSAPAAAAMSELPVESTTTLASTTPRPKGVTTAAPFTFPPSTKAPQPMVPNQMSAPASRSLLRHISIFCSGRQPVSGATSFVKPTRLPQ